MVQLLVVVWFGSGAGAALGVAYACDRFFGTFPPAPGQCLERAASSRGRVSPAQGQEDTRRA